MNLRQLIILTLISISLLLFCGKKEKKMEIESGIRLDISTSIDVNVPEVSWEKTLTILTPVNRTDNPDNETLSRLLKEQMTSGLSKTGKLKVISPDLVEKKAAEPDLVLQSELQEKAGLLVVSMKLTDMKTDSILLLQEFEEPLESFALMEETTASAVTQSIGLKDSILVQRETSPVPQDLMTLYLDAQILIDKNNRQDTDLAVDKFKEILKIDSTFALVYLGLTECYLQITNNRWDLNPVWQRLAQASCLKAIQLDPHLAEAHLYLGRVSLSRGDFKHAERHFRNALNENPSLKEAWAGLGKVFVHYGLYTPSLQVYERALELDPTDGETTVSRAMLLIGLNRYQDADFDLRQAIQYNPEKIYYHSFLALSKYYQGDYNSALNEIKQGSKDENYHPFSHAVLGMIYARQEKLDEALQEVELEVKPYIENNGSLATAVAAIYSLIGQKGLAVQWLKKAHGWGYKEYLWLVNDPNFTNLKDDERFIDLMDNMKVDWENHMQRYLESESI
jgi:tetratricopeptide (TPR) repeat protein